MEPGGTPLSPIFVALLGAMLVVAVSGVALTRSGHPFSAILLNVHKLVDLVILVAVGTVVVRDAGVASLSSIAITATALVASLQLVALISGGVVSARESAPPWVTWTHRVASWIAVLITLWWGVLFLA